MPDTLNTVEFIALLALVLGLLAWFAEKLLERFPQTRVDDPAPDVPPEVEHPKSFADSPNEFDLYGSVGSLLKVAFFVLPLIFLGVVLLVVFIFFDVIPSRPSALATTTGRVEFVALLALVLFMSVWLILRIIKLVRKVTH